MKIKNIIIHNFRSIKEESIRMEDYSLLVGPNNCGKSNIIDAIRIFYEKDGFKYGEADWPKLETDDEESWIEIEFTTTDEEYASLRLEYKLGNNTFKVRRYFKTEKKDKLGKPLKGIYGYEGSELSKNLFYGPGNIQSGKLGNVVYIPAISKLDEHVKLSGPSALRDLLAHVMGKVLEKSEAYTLLQEAFSDFNRTFQTERSTDDVSLEALKGDINNELLEWESEFLIKVNSLSPQDITKHLIKHEILDKVLGKEMPSSSFGQGFQRHLIFALIKLTAKYKDIKAPKDKKDFTPAFNLILYEEPEAFLHPPQQTALNDNLDRISDADDQQVLVSTHSGLFVGRNTDNLIRLVKVQKDGPKTKIYQIDELKLESILYDNKKIHKILGSQFNTLESESLRYFLWLNSERCSLFFAKKVLIVEGLTEKTLLEYLIKNKLITIPERQIHILDGFGKYNIHRFMNLFEKFGIFHGVILDDDENKNKHKELNELVTSSQNAFTLGVNIIQADFEDFLGIEKPAENHLKPLNALYRYIHGEINKSKIRNLEERVCSVISSKVS